MATRSDGKSRSNQQLTLITIITKETASRMSRNRKSSDAVCFCSRLEGNLKVDNCHSWYKSALKNKKSQNKQHEIAWKWKMCIKMSTPRDILAFKFLLPPWRLSQRVAFLVKVLSLLWAVLIKILFSSRKHLTRETFIPTWKRLIRMKNMWKCSACRNDMRTRFHPQKKLEISADFRL